MNSKKISPIVSIVVAFGALCIFNTGMTSQASNVEAFESGIEVKTVLDDYDEEKQDSERYMLVNIDGEIEPYLPITEKEYLGLVFAEVEEYTYVREEPDIESVWVGKLYTGGAAEGIGTAGEWTQIKSGNVTGYVLTEDLVMGEEAELLSEMVAINQIEVTAVALNVRTGPTTEAQILDTVSNGTELMMAGILENGWYPVLFGESVAYVHGDYVKESAKYSYAESKEEERARVAEYEAAVAQAEEEAQAVAMGEEVVAYAMQFVGNPYVWGGTSLENGADCSGFVQSVYKHFGVNLPRTSGEQRGAGVAVSYENAMPGDIVCYSGHVGIYMGDGQIVNALNSKRGITTIKATYNTIVSVRRVI